MLIFRVIMVMFMFYAVPVGIVSFQELTLEHVNPILWSEGGRFFYACFSTMGVAAVITLHWADKQ